MCKLQRQILSKLSKKAMQILSLDNVIVAGTWYDTPANYKSFNAFMQVVAGHLHIGFEFVDTFLERMNA